MANPRDLAEQAFALLQSALSESEARASGLDDQLKRKRTPKNRLEEQLDVLTHRLEKVEAERAHFEQQAGHLEEVAEAERTKVAQLKKKLQIAESGPEKLTKKEINFWRAKAEGIDTQVKEYQERLAALRRELNEREAEVDKLRAAGPSETPEPPSIQSDDELRQQLEQRDRWLAELRLELHELRAQPTPPLEAQVEVETLRSQVASLEQALADAHNVRAAVAADLSRAQQDLAANERGARETAAENERVRATLTEREHRIVELTAEVEHLRNDIRQREETERANSATHAEQVAALSRDIEALRNRCDQQDHEASTAKADFEHTLQEREQAESALAALQRERDSLRESLNASSRELDELRSANQQLEQRADQAEARSHEAEGKLADATAQLTEANARADEGVIRTAALERDLEAAREQLASLEQELKEEREHAESLSEIANERREHMTKLQEQAEEAEERYAEANWRLGKALYFEKLVKRRKGLIAKLLEALRAKMKTNTALKAGIDGLRTYKQTAEMNQHKLLQRIDALKAELKEADESVKRYQGGTAAKEELTTAIARATMLEERLNTQAELIQTLETDLKTARMSHKTGGERHEELERLTKELEAKTAFIERLLADTDEQQRKLGKLRGSESETARLRAISEKDRSEIDALQRELTELREALDKQNEQASVSQASGNNAELQTKLKERENSLTRLMGTIKDHETTIKQLTESAESWKRKYQFLAADQPDAYKNVSEK